MKYNELSSAETKKLRANLSIIWDIKHPYWYPLYDCMRNDIIAFNSNYIENKDKLENIRLLLMYHGVTNIYELREYGISNEVIDFSDYDFWLSDIYFWNNECFWFDNNMDWIIYVTHEGTTTFGGEWLVKEIKNIWVDWNNNTKWDTKNK